MSHQDLQLVRITFTHSTFITHHLHQEPEASLWTQTTVFHPVIEAAVHVLSFIDNVVWQQWNPETKSRGHRVSCETSNPVLLPVCELCSLSLWGSCSRTILTLYWGCSAVWVNLLVSYLDSGGTLKEAEYWINPLPHPHPVSFLAHKVAESCWRLMESGCYDSQHPGSRIRVWVISIASVSVVMFTVTSGRSERKDRNSWSIFFPEHLPSALRETGPNPCDDTRRLLVLL